MFKVDVKVRYCECSVYLQQFLFWTEPTWSDRTALCWFSTCYNTVTFPLVSCGIGMSRDPEPRARMDEGGGDFCLYCYRCLSVSFRRLLILSHLMSITFPSHELRRRILHMLGAMNVIQQYIPKPNNRVQCTHNISTALYFPYFKECLRIQTRLVFTLCTGSLCYSRDRERSVSMVAAELSHDTMARLTQVFKSYVLC